MTACGSLAREVPRRNLRSAAFVSCEKTYNLASELCVGSTSVSSVGNRSGGVSEDVPCCLVVELKTRWMFVFLGWMLSASF